MGGTAGRRPVGQCRGRRPLVAHGGLRVPLFAEAIALGGRVQRSDADLRAECRRRLREHLAWRPADNPVRRFEARCATELPLLQQEGMATYHAWAFANARQFGAAMELLAQHLRCLGGLDAVPTAFEAVARPAKFLS